jgi:excisionase family DNA binding protein
MNTMTTNDAFLTVAQVAARLQVSRATVYRLVSSGELPAVQLSGINSAIRISERELGEWLFDGRNEAA